MQLDMKPIFLIYKADINDQNMSLLIKVVAEFQ